MVDHSEKLAEACSTCSGGGWRYDDPEAPQMVGCEDCGGTGLRAQKPEPVGIFRDHRCWKCDDGRRKCVTTGGPNNCGYPHARND